MRSTILFLSFSLFFVQSSFAQDRPSFGPGGTLVLTGLKITPVVHEVNFEGLDLNNRLPYARIKGTPFWKSDWQVADLYTHKNKIVTVPARINLITNEIHFLQDDQEFVLESADITKVVFRTDSAVFIRDVPNLFLNKKKMDQFVQVMNNGKYQLLKYLDRRIGSADSLFNTEKRYYFQDQNYYFLKVDDRVEHIKKLGEDHLLSLLPAASVKQWIKQKKLNLKKEEDVLLLLEHFNSRFSALAE